MKILLLDDTKPRRNQLVDALQKKRYEVTSCYGTNDFVNAVEKHKADMILLDMESWYRGRAIYDYLNLAKRLENLPILFYNAHMNFSILNNRPRHAKDRILFKPSEVDAILGSLQENR
jgi:DNA-binding NtrC family response regulator